MRGTRPVSVLGRGLDVDPVELSRLILRGCAASATEPEAASNF